MTPIDAVLFDLDGTLLQYRRSPGDVLQSAFETVGVEGLFSVAEYEARYDEFAADHDSIAALRSACFAALAAENCHPRRVGRAVAAAFEAERDQSNVELLPDVPRVLSGLSERFRVGVVTNGAPDAQRAKLDAVDLDRWVDATVVAGHRVPPKPDPAPFERALRAVDATADAAVHVGDTPETDVAGAAAAGVDSVLVAEQRDADGPEPTYRVDTIAGVLTLPWATGAD